VAAFRAAWLAGADGIECDLRLTRDGAVVAMHDATAGRTTGDPRPLSQITRGELQKLDAGRWKAAAFVGERVPTLHEILADVPENKMCVLELKEGQRLVERVAATLQEIGQMNSKITLIGFDYQTICEARKCIPSARALWLFNDYRNIPRAARQCIGDWLSERVHEAGLHGLDLGFGRDLTPKLVADLKVNGYDVFTYTINTRGRYQRCLEAGVDAITTDFPMRWRLQE